MTKPFAERLVLDRVLLAQNSPFPIAVLQEAQLSKSSTISGGTKAFVSPNAIAMLVSTGKH